MVTETGDVDSVLVIHPLGAGLELEAVAAARNLKFKPAENNGKPIPFWMKVVIEFNLK